MSQLKGDEGRLLTDEEIAQDAKTAAAKDEEWESRLREFSLHWGVRSERIVRNLLNDLDEKFELWGKRHDGVREKKCEACADGFISTHEKATNDIRTQKDAEWEDRLSKEVLRQAEKRAKLRDFYRDRQEELVKEHQAKVERIFREMEEDFEDIKGTLWQLNIAKFRWQALKQQYLKEGVE